MVTKTIAKGNGYTGDFNVSVSATDDQTTIKQALDSLSPGDTLKFYPGIYICSRPIYSTNTGIYITSVDINNLAMLKVKEYLVLDGTWGHSACMLDIGNSANISYLTFDGSQGKVPGEGAAWYNLLRIHDNSIVDKCILQNTGFDGVIHGSNNKILNSYFYNTRHDAIVGADGANYNLIDSNYQIVLSRETSPGTPYAGPSWSNNFHRLYSGHDNVFSNNVIEMEDPNSAIMQMAWQIIGHNDRDTSNNLIINNVVGPCYYAPIWWYESGMSPQTRASYMSGLVIKNNLFLGSTGSAGGFGIGFSSSYANANINNVTIENNTIIANKFGVREYTSYAVDTPSPPFKPYCGDTTPNCHETSGSRVVLSDINIRNNIFICQLTGIKCGVNGNPGAFNVNSNCIYTPSTEKLSPGIAPATGNIYTNPMLDSTYRVPTGNPAFGLGANIDLLPAPYGNDNPSCPLPQFNFDITQV